MKNGEQKVEIVFPRFLEISLRIRQGPVERADEMPALVSSAGSVAQRLHAVHRDGCLTSRFFLGLERESRGKVSQSIILPGCRATLEKLHVPLSMNAMNGHLHVTTLFDCPASWNSSQHGVSKQHHSQAAPSLCLLPRGQ